MAGFKEAVNEAKLQELRGAVLAYLSECDNPVPDYMHRKTLRDRLRELVGAPPARIGHSGRFRS